MTEKKNIAIIVPTVNKGGAERVAANLSLEFAKHYHVYLIVHDASDITYPYAGELIDLQLPPGGGFFRKITTMVKRVAKVRKIKKKYHIHYSISHLPPSNYVNVFSRAGDRVFCYVHSMEKPTLANRLREKVVAMGSDKIICVSECVRENMVKNFGISHKKAVTIYNFCDLKTPAVVEEKQGTVIANMGRLFEPKGQWHLIRAMKQVVRQCPEARLIIYGEGGYRTRLEELIHNLQLEHCVTLAGFLDDPFARLAQADVFVSSSLWEGLPMALIEAGCCGLPVVSTDCDAGCREILAPNTPISRKTKEIEEGEYGVLVPVCTEGTYSQTEITQQEMLLAQAILLLIQDEQKREYYASRARERARDFRPEILMEQWKRLLG